MMSASMSMESPAAERWPTDIAGSSQPLYLQFPIAVEDRQEPISLASPASESQQNKKTNSPRDKKKRRKPWPKQKRQLGRTLPEPSTDFSDYSSSSSPASCSEVERSLKGGPRLHSAPTYHGRLLHDMLWDRLNSPAFFPGPLTRDPVHNLPGVGKNKWWYPRILFGILIILFDEMTHQGCVRMRTLPMRRKIIRELEGSPEIIKDWRIFQWILRWKPGRDNLAESPEVVKRPYYEKKLPKVSYYPHDSDDCDVDVDGHHLSADGKVTDEWGRSDEDLEKCYVVIGIFSKTSMEPVERLVRIEFDDDFFHVLRREVRKLRWCWGFFSLKSLSGFGLYRCNLKNFNFHPRVQLNDRNQEILQHLSDAYKMNGNLFVKNSSGWRNWVCKNLNGGNHDPTRPGKHGGYSLECLFQWSTTRIAFFTLTPLLVSLMVGIWYQNVTGDVQTAWSIAAYVVTAAALFLAFLGVIGQLSGH